MLSPAKGLALSLVEQSWLTTRGLQPQSVVVRWRRLQYKTSALYPHTVELEGTMLSPATELILLLVEPEWRLFSCRKTQRVASTSCAAVPMFVVYCRSQARSENTALPSCTLRGMKREGPAGVAEKERSGEGA